MESTSYDLLSCRVELWLVTIVTRVEKFRRARNQIGKATIVNEL